MRLSKKASIMFTAGLLTVATAGGAYAYWTTTGSGTGAASTGTNTAVTVTQLGSVTALTPGSAAQPINFKINNSAATAQYVTSVVVSLTVPPGAGPGPSCTASDFTLVQPSSIARDLPNGDTSFLPSGASLALTNSALNQDNCKSANVVLTFTAS